MSWAPYTPQSQTDMIADLPISSAASKSPNFTLHRTKEDAIDAAVVPTNVKLGMNMAGYDTAIIQVVPKAGTPTPNITVYQWSEDAGKFIQFVAAKAASAPGANTPYTYECAVNEAIIWVGITSGTMSAGHIVDILIAGCDV